jgi:hypothetical protein
MFILIKLGLIEWGIYGSIYCLFWLKLAALKWPWFVYINMYVICIKGKGWWSKLRSLWLHGALVISKWLLILIILNIRCFLILTSKEPKSVSWAKVTLSWEILVFQSRLILTAIKGSRCLIGTLSLYTSHLWCYYWLILALDFVGLDGWLYVAVSFV